MKLYKLIVLSSFFLLVAELSAQSFVGCPSGKERIPSSNIEIEQEVLRLVNQERSKRNLPELLFDEHLAYAARYHCKDMIVDKYFDHEGYDRIGRRLKKVCGTFDKIEKFVPKEMFVRSENIGAGQQTAKEMVDTWMGSGGHRDNILDKSITHMGVGFVEEKGSEWGTYWVQNFGIKK